MVKLTDFGIAKLLDAQGVTSTGQVLGSPAHMAPEQIEGGDVDARADVFGLGVLLYECMVGHLPFEGNNPAQVLRRVLDGVYPSARAGAPHRGQVVERDPRSRARQASRRIASPTRPRCATRWPAELDAPRHRRSAERARGLVRRPGGLRRAAREAHDRAAFARGLAARKEGDALAAAADYNRALAYAPHDPQLLKIVAHMDRDEARRQLVRRLAPLVAGALGMGLVAFFVTRILHPHGNQAGGRPISPMLVRAPIRLPLRRRPVPCRA